MPNTPNLDRYIELKRQVEELTGEMSDIQGAATEELMGLVMENPDGKQTVQRLNAKAQLKLRTWKPKPKDDQDLESLDDLIAAEREVAIAKNKAEIDELKRRSKDLEAMAEKLSLTDAGRDFVKEYKAREKLLTEKRPTLAIILEKNPVKLNHGLPVEYTF